MVQLWMLLPPDFISTLLLWFYSSLPLNVSLTLYLIEAYRLQDVSAGWAPAAGDAASPQVAIAPLSQSGMKSCL